MKLLCKLGIHNWHKFSETFIDKHHPKRSFIAVGEICLVDGCDAYRFIKELPLTGVDKNET